MKSEFPDRVRMPNVDIGTEPRSPLEPAAADTPDLGQAEDDWLFDQSPAHEEP